MEERCRSLFRPPPRAPPAQRRCNCIKLRATTLGRLGTVGGKKRKIRLRLAGKSAGWQLLFTCAQKRDAAARWHVTWAAYLFPPAPPSVQGRSQKRGSGGGRASARVSPSFPGLASTTALGAPYYYKTMTSCSIWNPSRLARSASDDKGL